MLDRHTEAELLKSLAETYQNMVEMTARGKLGGDGGDTMSGARAAQGGGRLGTFTPARGIGADKRHKNNPAGDEARKQTYDKQTKIDRAADRATSAEDKSEGKDKSPGIKAAEAKAKFTPHTGPMKVKKLKPARGPRSRR